MDVRHHLLQLVDEEVGEAEAYGNTKDRRHTIGREKFPERDMCDARRQEGRRPEAITCGTVTIVFTVCRRYAALNRSSRSRFSTSRTARQFSTRSPQCRPAPVKHHIPRQNPEDAHGKLNPPSREVFMRQHGGRDNRDFLWNWHAERGQ